MSVRAHSRRDGSVVLEIAVPGAGHLSATARSLVSRSARSRHHVHSSAGHVPPAHSLAKRTVASAVKPSQGEGVLVLRLVPGSSYRPLTMRHGGLQATVSVALYSAGHRPLLKRVPVRFVRAKHRRRTHRASRVAGRGAPGAPGAGGAR